MSPRVRFRGVCSVSPRNARSRAAGAGYMIVACCWLVPRPSQPSSSPLTMPESISPSSSQSNQDASAVTGTYPSKNRLVQCELKFVKHKLSFKRPATQTKKAKVSPLSPPPSELIPSPRSD